jgi:hypothetical protein
MDRKEATGNNGFELDKRETNNFGIRTTINIK